MTEKAEKMQLLWHCHTANLAAHAGVNATLEKVSMTHYWHGMKDDVRRYVSAVFFCIEFPFEIICTRFHSNSINLCFHLPQYITH